MRSLRGLGKAYHTIIVVPHARARFLKFRITNRRLLAVFGGVVALTGLSLFSTWSLVTNNVDVQALAKVSNENQVLREVNQTTETTIRTLHKQLADFEERTRRLAIVAGLESLAIGPEAGIGGGEPAGDSALAELNARSNLLTRELSRLEARFDERQRWIASTPAIAPVRGILTSGFGYRRDPMTGERDFHHAIDIATAPGRPVRAAADGIVVRAGRLGRLGNAVYVSHGYGVTTRYGHLSRIGVEPGTRLKRGDILGFVGSTGRATGYHLHYEVRVDGEAVNPLAYILDSPNAES